jgi:hypothetical protein
MQKKSSLKSALVLIGILVIAAGAYFYMSGTPTDDSTLLVEESGSDVEVVGTRVLTLLNQIQRLTIDEKFFSSATFSSLVDHTVPIYEQNVGKGNPFFNPKAKAK